MRPVDGAARVEVITPPTGSGGRPPEGRRAHRSLQVFEHVFEYLK